MPVYLQNFPSTKFTNTTTTRPTTTRDTTFSPSRRFGVTAGALKETLVLFASWQKHFLPQSTCRSRTFSPWRRFGVTTGAPRAILVPFASWQNHLPPTPMYSLPENNEPVATLRRHQWCSQSDLFITLLVGKTTSYPNVPADLEQYQLRRFGVTTGALTAIVVHDFASWQNLLLPQCTRCPRTMSPLRRFSVTTGSYFAIDMEDYPLPEIDDQTLMDILQIELDALLPVEQAQTSNTTPISGLDSTTTLEDNQSTHNMPESQNMQQDQSDFQTLVGDLAYIRAATQVPAFGLAALPTAPEPSTTPPGSPIRQHPSFQPSPAPYQSPFQPTPNTHTSFFEPQVSPQPDRPIDVRLLETFIGNLPLHKPSPFKTEIFVESPTGKQRLVQKPVAFKETDEEGRVTRWVEMGLVSEDRLQHRRHCVVAGTSKVAVDNIEGQHFVDGDCAVWTRKYPEGWKGYYKNEAGETVEIEKIKTGPNTVWCFSATATVILDGVEACIECAVPKNLVDIEGVQYEVEPAWQDVVRCLKKAIEVPQVNESAPSPKKSPRRTRKAPNKGKMAQQNPDTLQSLPSQSSAQPSSYALSPFASQTSAQRTTEQTSTHTIPSAMEKGKGVVRPNQFNENTIQHTPFNELPQGHHTVGMNPTPPSSSHEVLGSPLDFWNHGVEESSHDERQENVVTVPGIEAVGHAHTQDCNVPSQIVDPHYVIAADGSYIPSQGITHAPNSQSTVTAMVPERDQDPLPAQEQPKPKRKRAPPKKKQTQSMQDVPDHSVQTSEAAEAETPPSMAKRGRKRKDSSAASTPAKKTTAEKNTPGTKTPAKRRASAKTTIPDEPSEKQEDGEQGESTAAILNNDTISPPQFGPGLPSTNQNQVSMPMRNNQTVPMTNPMPPAGSFGANRSILPPQQSRDQRLLSIFDQQRELWLIITEPGRVNKDPLQLQRVQHRLRQLDVERDYLLGYQRPAFQQGMGQFPLPGPRTNPMQPFNIPQAPNSHMFPAQQSPAPQYSGYQMSGTMQNPGPYPNQYQPSRPQWYNQPVGSFSGPAVPSQYQNPMAYSAGPSMSNMNVPSGYGPPNQYASQPTTSPAFPASSQPTPTQNRLAEWPAEDVERARSSVQSTLQRPVSRQASPYNLTFQEEDAAIDPNLTLPNVPGGAEQ
ncbi:hypothetical protein NA56DRAFT_747343 [Hyaloscypha hepaticicola]|uniref:Uncharacterized protein n=1 Tax=Hyaloscypha hepaticicola TaxID=2082293 RepID=A0A2J6QB88_9HELO|nr:hypothetical protein NA56DRAFT_747343 [Hyaloscypha hepaticicola]